jgi:RNA polymerase sigma-70 factor (ECF subfamily)
MTAEFMMPDRTNEGWLEALSTSGPARETALADLRQLIVASLGPAIGRSPAPDDVEFGALAEDVAQETLLKVLSHLDTFEGRSHFTTWVLTISVRAAYTELRRRHWKDVSLDQIVAEHDEPSAPMPADPAVGPERAAEQANMAALVNRMLMEELTERQRRAMMAVMGGMPLEEVARRLGTERNALYKLLHDARLKLRRRLEREGLSPGEVLALFKQT